MLDHVGATRNRTNMKKLKRCLLLILPVLIIGSLWVVAIDSQESERFHQTMRYVPAVHLTQDTLTTQEPVVGIGAALLRSLLPA